jgi:hypothetical protein
MIQLQSAPPHPQAVLKHRVPKDRSVLDEVHIPEYLEPLCLDNGYLPGRIGARKLTPAIRDNKLTLAPTSTNTINFETLVEDHPHLQDVLAPIREPTVFRALFKGGLEPRTRRPLSRDMKAHHEALLEYDIAEPYAAPADPAVFHALAFVVWCVLFLVPKKAAGLGRLVVDAREVNRAQQRPGEMGLIRLHDLIRSVLSFSHAAKSDGCSYFYQFLLHPDIRPFFRSKLANWRGSIIEVMLKRMPMGWSWSPRIAQFVSNAIIRGLGVAWLDDFIIGGRDEQEFAEATAEFRRRVQRCNVAMDDLTLAPSTRLEAVGLEFDLTTKQYRLAPSWVEKKDFTPLKPGACRTYRDWFRLYGALVWADHATARPLFLRAEALAALSALARAVDGDYDRITEMPAYAIANVNEWMAEVAQNAWHFAPEARPEQPSDYIFSDASGHSSAWVRIAHDTIVDGDQWSTDDDRHIFLKELEALLEAATTCKQKLSTTLFVTDNAPSNFALRKKHSSSYKANVMMRTALGRSSPLWSMWTSTYKMIADEFTRGSKLPTLPSPLSAEQQVSLLHARRLWDSEIEAKSCLPIV